MKSDDFSSVTQSYDIFSSSTCPEGEDKVLGEGTSSTSYLPGRDSQKLELLDVYQRLLQTQESQVVFVHGTSGQGKTSLVDTLRGPVCESNGYFCSGKFFQDPGIQEPYSALTAAFSEICDLVVQSPDFHAQSPGFDEESQVRIQEFLSTHGHLLSRSVNLSPFFKGDSPDQYCLRGSTAEKPVTFARFRAACKAFLLAMTSAKHPLVLFIDDTQWMDAGSEKLLDIMQDGDIKNVMLVLSYRDEEASAVEGILRAYNKGERVTDIQLSSLDLSGVRQILAHQLGTMASKIDELSELTLQRTGGNPFFVSLFLETLQAEALLTMNGVCPTFNVEEIRRSIMVADSIADCLSQKVSRLPCEVRSVLTVASLIGFSFNEEILFEVPDIVAVDAMSDKEKRKKIVALLTSAVDGGFIERIRSGSYQFAHDKLQSTFQGLVDKPTREHFHLLIGKMFLAQITEGSIYNAAVHLNVAPGFIDSKARRLQLARINLGGSHFCKQSSAFYMSVSLLRRGIELLDSINMMWSPEAMELSMELTESLARMALLIGDFDTCYKATKEGMLHADTRERKVNLLLTNVECRMANNDMQGSIRASTEALSELGVKLPRKATMRHVVFKITRLQFSTTCKINDDMLSLPPLEDGSHIAIAIRLLMHITFYSILINDRATGIYANLVAMNLTLQHGLSTYAAPILSIFAVAVLQTGNIDRAYDLGKLAQKLMERCPSREADCATVGFANPLLLHWKEPVLRLRDPLVDAAMAGFDMGEVIYSTYCVSQGFNMDLFNGIHLEVLEMSLQSQYDRIHKLGQEELLEWIRPYMQYVANMRSSSTDWCQLSLMSGEYTDFEKTMSESNASSNLVLVAAGTSVLKARSANAFGYHATARKIFEDLEPLGHVLHSVFVFNVMCWEACVAYYEGFLADGKREHLRKARKYRKHLEQRDALGPNASIFLRHLQLKVAFMRRPKRRIWSDSPVGDDETLRRLDRELENVPVSGDLCYVAARAFVDAGAIAEKMGRFGEARQYYERAGGVYIEKWGAFALGAWLEDKCETLPTRDQLLDMTFNTRQSLVGDIVQCGCGEELIDGVSEN